MIVRYDKDKRIRVKQEGIDAVIDYKKDHGKRRADLAIMEIKELIEKR